MIKYLPLILIVGCGPPPQNNFLHLHIDNSNELVIDAAHQLMTDINVATKCEIFGENSTDIRRQIVLEESKELVDDALGIFNPNNNSITLSQVLIWDSWYHPRIKIILMHEVGHSLGLGHIEDTFMSKNYDSSISYEKALQQFNTLIQQHGLNPCDLPGHLLPPNE